MEYMLQLSSPLGPLTLISDGQSLTGLRFGSLPPEKRDCIHKDLPLWGTATAWLRLYFSGRDPGPVPFPLTPAGTAFQQQVWKKLLEIPYGETVSYAALAGTFSSSMSPQAIGNSVKKNPIAIVIPCHRVIGADGSLTGYAWGLERKAFLLNLERKKVQF